MLALRASSISQLVYALQYKPKDEPLLSDDSGDEGPSSDESDEDEQSVLPELG